MEVDFVEKYKIGHKIMAPLLDYANKKLIKNREKHRLLQIHIFMPVYIEKLEWNFLILYTLPSIPKYSIH